jgi:hypothetical protein
MDAGYVQDPLMGDDLDDPYEGRPTAAEDVDEDEKVGDPVLPMAVDDELPGDDSAIGEPGLGHTDPGAGHTWGEALHLQQDAAIEALAAQRMGFSDAGKAARVAHRMHDEGYVYAEVEDEDAMDEDERGQRGVPRV